MVLWHCTNILHLHVNKLNITFDRVYCCSLRDPIEGMMHDDFLRLMARYKFTIVAENGVCDDYITEKLWRTLTVGSVPIIIGSKKIRVRCPGFACSL